jgi:hypothetical protein
MSHFKCVKFADNVGFVSRHSLFVPYSIVELFVWDGEKIIRPISIKFSTYGRDYRCSIWAYLPTMKIFTGEARISGAGRKRSPSFVVFDEALKNAGFKFTGDIQKNGCDYIKDILHSIAGYLDYSQDKCFINTINL